MAVSAEIYGQVRAAAERVEAALVRRKQLLAVKAGAGRQSAEHQFRPGSAAALGAAATLGRVWLASGIAAPQTSIRGRHYYYWRHGCWREGRR